MTAQEILHFLNKENTKYAGLYRFRAAIEEHKIYEHLRLRDRLVLSFTEEVLKEGREFKTEGAAVSAYLQETKEALRWMLETGFKDDGLDSSFDRVLDGCAAFLTVVYGDRSILPAIAEAIFRRHRVGFYYNDLIWAFFEAKYPDSLVLIACRLQSEHPKDVELARKLLAFALPENISRNNSGEWQYLAVTHWLEENRPFLYYTGECFQQTSYPKPYRVVLEAKYLCKCVAADTGRTVEPLTKEEKKLLSHFRLLNYDAKAALAEYSARLHKDDIFLWKQWMERPFETQLQMAVQRMGGSYD